MQVRKERSAVTLLTTVCFSFLLLTLGGCSGQPRTFAGFTYGGGGNTYSAEPARLGAEGDLSYLEAGTGQGDVNLRLTWPTSDELKAPLKLSAAEVTVKEKGGASRLVEGTIVIQTVDGPIVHGSFDLDTQSEDGRRFEVVGSFTGQQQQQQ